MKLMTHDMQRNLAVQRMKDADELEIELLGQAEQVNSVIRDMRSKIDSHRNSATNITGFLIGQTNDYLETFEAQTA